MWHKNVTAGRQGVHALQTFLIRGNLRLQLIKIRHRPSGSIGRRQIAFLWHIMTSKTTSRATRENLYVILSKTTSRRARVDFEIHRKFDVKISTTLRLFYFMRKLTPWSAPLHQFDKIEIWIKKIRHRPWGSIWRREDDRPINTI